MRSILVIASHPDAEILVCGSNISNHVQSGDEVNVILVSEGITSRSQKRNKEKDEIELNDLLISAQKANNIIVKQILRSFKRVQATSPDIITNFKL